MHYIETWMGTLSPIWVYLLVGAVIGVESMGVPLPGEIALVTASLLSVTTAVNPWVVAGAASVGAIAGDSIGYLIGRRGGRALLERFGRRFPKHFGPPHLAKAERAFQRWGVWAVFFGRFIALLRILAGPLAGALRVPYGKFLIANALGGITWSFGTVFAIYSLGRVAEKWLKDFSWVALAAAVVAGLVTTFYLRRRAAAEARALRAEADKEPAATP
ncbi:DedA family protein [Dactylosporangium sp. NPDC048998]|uniref:DedA family protein n=1 Tax=Dactylosporangium sp. NPDC048998 TaxID=3363976 RepID=UPI0037188ED7